jgi:RNA polymerase sigma-70 factor, ECF subfamily
MRALPHDNFVQINGQTAMKNRDSRTRSASECSEISLRSSATERDHHPSDPSRSSAEETNLTVDDLQDRMVKLLPRLRRFVHSLTGGAESSEDLVQETYLRALAHLDQWHRGTRLDSWMFRIAQNLWIDQMRMLRVRGDFVDIEIIGELLTCDGAVIAENRIVLQQLRKDIAQLSLDQRNVISLVCAYGLSYKETGEILNLPAGTVMSRLARARDALQKYA